MKKVANGKFFAILRPFFPLDYLFSQFLQKWLFFCFFFAQNGI